MNLYSTVSKLKADLSASSPFHDADYVRALDDASGAVNQHVKPRVFYATTATRTFDGNGGCIIWFEDDLVSATTVKLDEDGDGTFEVTLVVNTDYWLLPDNGSPKRGIELNTLGQRLTFIRRRKLLQVVGIWGYSNDTELTGAALDEADDGAETELHLDSPGLIDVGETIVIGTEQLYVSKVDGNILTVVRGINGSTAASHSDGDTVYRRRYPADVEWATRIIALRQLWGAAGGQQGLADFGGQPPEMMGQSARSASPWRVLAPYRIPVVA